MTGKQPRDVRGRFQRIDPVRDVLAPGLGVPQTYAGGLRPRHAPAGDELAGTPHPGLLHPRIARTVSGGSERTVYATPRAGTLNDAVHTGESGRPWAQQSAYILSDVDETAPGEVAATARFGIQGAHVRAAARRGTDPMDPSKYLSGADDAC